MIGGSLKGAAVLVTGGAGFIGSHLVDALLACGASVRVLDNLSTGRTVNIRHCLERIDFVQGDIRDPQTCESACAGTACVFHQAALGSVPRSIADPATSIAVNVTGTANVFAAARKAGVKRVVYASSSSIYGDSQRLPKREGEEGEPLSPYALSKAMDEELAGTFARCYGIEFVGLRYFNVYGPRQDPESPYAAAIPLFFKAYMTGGVPKIHGDGEQSRDFTFVQDAVEANLLAAEAPEAACGRAYNVAGGRRVTVNALAGLIRRLAGGNGAPEHGPERPGDVKHSLADLSAARELLRYEPRTGIEDGLAEARSYYRSLYGGADA
jgi:UDP-N-acetylglucosamine/UDP-N-acetylgalactosamine 4-epimerase